MEKKTPHYALSEIKALVEHGIVKSTRTALEGAAALGLDFEDMKDVITSLESRDFYKSMTSHENYAVWQDVYHFPAEVGDIYLKLSVTEGVLIVSFKEL